MADVRSAQFLADVSQAFRQCRNASLAVAFVSQSGLELNEFKPALESALGAGASVRLLLDLSMGNTDPTAVWGLVTLSETYPHAEVRALLPEQGHLLHSKFYLFDLGSEVVLVSGSANLTGPAFTSNVEHGLTITGTHDDPLLAGATGFFEQMWRSPASRLVDRQAARLYEDYCGRLRAGQSRAEKRARARLRSLEAHLGQRPYSLVWPSAEAAFVLGAVCARGWFEDELHTIKIRLNFNPASYAHREIRVAGTAYAADQVIPTIAAHIAERIASYLPGTVTHSSPRVITIDLAQQQPLYNILRAPLSPATTPLRFRLPNGLVRADDDIVAEFLRGFALASALVTDATSLPGSPITGLPGIQTVWLRPQTGNKPLFDALHELIDRRFGFRVYTHWREYREPHLKIRCEDFALIGFGIPWWDALVEAGAAYNQMPLG